MTCIYFSPECLGHGGGELFHTELTVETFTCKHEDTVTVNGTEYFNGTYNAFATIFFSSGQFNFIDSCYHFIS